MGSCSRGRPRGNTNPDSDRTDERFTSLGFFFILGITFALIVILAVSSSYRSTSFSSGVSRSDSTGTRRSATTPAIIAWRQIALEMLPSLRDTRGQLSFWSNVLSIGLWAMFVVGAQPCVSFPPPKY